MPRVLADCQIVDARRRHHPCLAVARADAHEASRSEHDDETGRLVIAVRGEGRIGAAEKVDPRLRVLDAEGLIADGMSHAGNEAAAGSLSAAHSAASIGHRHDEQAVALECLGSVLGLRPER
jgi:hypothetical protein